MEIACAELWSELCAILCTYFCMLPGEAAPAPLLRTTVSGFSLRSNPVRTSQTSACSHQGIKHGWVCAQLSLGRSNTSVSRGIEVLMELHIHHNDIFTSLQSKISPHKFPLSSVWASSKVHGSQMPQINRNALMAESAIDISFENIKIIIYYNEKIFQ